METIRAFIAVDIGNEVRNRLRTLIDELKTSAADVRWVTPEKMHLTLAFLGNVESEKLRPLESALRANLQAQESFELNVCGTGVFGRSSRPNVVWAGLDESAQLLQLQQRVVSALDQAGIEFDNKPFRPHLTLGRFKSRKNAEALFQLLEKHQERPIGTAHIHSVETIKSELKPTGAVYTVLHSVRFTEG